MHCFIPLNNYKPEDFPTSFTNPFDYSAHPYCLEAKHLLEPFLPNPSTMDKGKMYGVLVVRNKANELGFLAAYSGNEQNITVDIPFVPQVFDITNPKGFFRKEEELLNQINQQIALLTDSSFLKDLEKRLKVFDADAKLQIINAKASIKKAKEAREHKRSSTNDEQLLALMIKESQTEKSNFNKLKKQLKAQQEQLENELSSHRENIQLLKQKRKQQSAKIQKQLFDSYVFLNNKGELKSATDIFLLTEVKVPPAGTGDCAAPKLLHYAFTHNLEPVAMAEFWWGPSPAKAIRKHNYFYPACKSKCEPILGFMLQGLNIEKSDKQTALSISIIYEDEHLAVINKPAGLLSVPGKELNESVLTQAQKIFSKATGPLIVHRLDMATSGLMLIAKSKAVHEHLQKQFLAHSIKKQYVAILDGNIEKNAGEINLPLRVDLYDRPRQVVCFEHGKPAITHWQIIKKINGQTKVIFYPVTGRTHQLRVHAAHQLGLNTPIVGDPLYGQKARRLMLHARAIEFWHPFIKKRLSFTRPEETQANWNEI